MVEGVALMIPFYSFYKIHLGMRSNTKIFFLISQMLNNFYQFLFFLIEAEKVKYF